MVYCQNDSTNYFDNCKEIYTEVFRRYLSNGISKNFGDEVFVEFDIVSTAALPNEVSGYKLRKIILNEHFFKNKNKFIYILRMVPLRFVSGEFVINVLEFKAFRDKHGIKLENIMEGKRYKLEYDCLNKKIILID